MHFDQSNQNPSHDPEQMAAVVAEVLRRGVTVPEFLSPRQAAVRWNFGEEQLAKWRATWPNGDCMGPPFTRPGGNKVMYPVRDGDEWMRRHLVRTAAAEQVNREHQERRGRGRVKIERRVTVHVFPLADLPPLERMAAMVRRDDRVRCYRLLGSLADFGGLSVAALEDAAIDRAEQVYRDAADSIREQRGQQTRAYSVPLSRQQVYTLIAHTYGLNPDANAARWFRDDERMRHVRKIEQTREKVCIHLGDLAARFPELAAEDLSALRVAQSDASQT